MKLLRSVVQISISNFQGVGVCYPWGDSYQNRQALFHLPHKF